MSEVDDNFEIDGDEADVVEAEAVEEGKDEQEGEQEEQPKRQSGYIDYDALEAKLGKEETDRIRGRVGEDFRKGKEAERKIQELQSKLDEMQAKEFERSKPKEVSPPTQDDWLDDPEAAARKQQEWANSQMQINDWEAQNKARQQQAEQAKQQAQQAAITKYQERAKAAKIDPQKMQYAGALVGEKLNYNPLGQQIADFIVGHEYGPQLVAKLAEDQAALLEVASLSMVEAVVKLDRMSDQFKRKTKSSAPPPDEPIRNTGKIPNDEELAGFTFE